MEWTPTTKQAQAISRKEREILYGGARGGGKTAAGLVWLTCDPDYIGNKNYRGLVIRKSYQDLSDWISRARILLAGRADIFTHPAEIRYQSGAVIYMGHWGDPSAVSMYLGREFQKILAEELTDIFYIEDDYLKLLGSLRSSDSTLQPQFFGTTNPGGRGHSWVKKRFVDCATNKTYYDPNTGHTRIYIPSRVTDNPHLVNADPAYISYLDSLPDRLKKAWRDGSWELAEGAFFTDFGIHMAEQPFEVQEHECIDGHRLFGSMDVGKCLSYGQWYVAPDNTIHRLFTYYAELNSIRDHAVELKNIIQTHRNDYGHFPHKIFVGPDAWTKRGTDELVWRSPIDEFIDLWPRHVEFERANDNRVNGCLIMQDLFRTRDGRPQVYFVDKFNSRYADAIPSAMRNPNNPDEYEKTSAWTDHLVDEVRYGLVGIYTWLTGEKKSSALKLQAKQYNEQFAATDWYNM
jgi:hypothetical protein